jgi:hypothetical protein
MSLSTSPSRGARILNATPILGSLARDISRDINTVFYLLVILITLVVLAIKVWGVVALAMSALALVPMVFVILLWITLP